MAEAWTLKGITPQEREQITAAAQAAEVPISRFIVRACMAAIGGLPAPAPVLVPQQNGAQLERFERLARLAHEIRDGKSRSCMAAKRTLTSLLEAEASVLLPALPAPAPGPVIEGKAA